MAEGALSFEEVADRIEAAMKLFNSRQLDELADYLDRPDEARAQVIGRLHARGVAEDLEDLLVELEAADPQLRSLVRIETRARANVLLEAADDDTR